MGCVRMEKTAEGISFDIAAVRGSYLPWTTSGYQVSLSCIFSFSNPVDPVNPAKNTTSSHPEPQPAAHWLRSPWDFTRVAHVLGSLSQWHQRGKAASHWLRSPRGFTRMAHVLGSLSQWHQRGKAASHWLRSPRGFTRMAHVLGSLSQWHQRGKAASHWLRSPWDFTRMANVIGSLSQWHVGVKWQVLVSGPLVPARVAGPTSDSSCSDSRVRSRWRPC